MGAIEFKAWPKIPRLKKDMVVTEKIDGTNAAVIVHKVEHGDSWDNDQVESVTVDGEQYLVAAQSRNKLVTPGKNDNAGFAGWAFPNAEDLARLLGPGHHYGEWWGQGIQRRYGMTEKKFSLFNVHRYSHLKGVFHQIDLVPHLYSGPFNISTIDEILENLRLHGSEAAPGFMDPEGVVVYHAGTGNLMKAFVEDTGPKGANG